jgi:GNAT superfamily N-acetyltransferase
VTDATVRAATDDDLPAIAGLRWRWDIENGESPGITREDFVRTFTEWAGKYTPTHHCVIATREGAVIGMAWLAVLPRVPTPRSPERAVGDVQSVYVVPEERSAGLGSRMIEALLDRARSLGLERVTVHSTTRAIPAYQRHGFGYAERLLELEIAHRKPLVEIDGAAPPHHP